LPNFGTSEISYSDSLRFSQLKFACEAQRPKPVESESLLIFWPPGTPSIYFPLNDMSIIALAKCLELPVVSMETRIIDLNSSSKRRIPNICDAEGIVHHTFNEFLRTERFKAKR
jgi:hypothetical protein